MRYIIDYFIQTRRIFLFKEINDRTTIRIVNIMKFLSGINKLPIFLYINSPGGGVDNAKSIIDEILSLRESGIEIWTVVQGAAQSAAADILSLGTPGRRYASKYSTIMLHPISYDLSPDYQAIQEQTTKFYSKDAEIMSQLIASACGKNTNKKYKKFKEDIEKSLWLTAQEAIDYGVIDNIWSYKIEEEINEIINKEEDN